MVVLLNIVVLLIHNTFSVVAKIVVSAGLKVHFPRAVAAVYYHFNIGLFDCSVDDRIPPLLIYWIYRIYSQTYLRIHIMIVIDTGFY